MDFGFLLLFMSQISWHVCDIFEMSNCIHDRGPGHPDHQPSSSTISTTPTINPSILWGDRSIPTSGTGQSGLALQGENLVWTPGRELGPLICNPPSSQPEQLGSRDVPGDSRWGPDGRTHGGDERRHRGCGCRVWVQGLNSRSTIGSNGWFESLERFLGCKWLRPFLLRIEWFLAIPSLECLR